MPGGMLKLQFDQYKGVSSFPNINSLKAEQKLVIAKVVQKRDVFAQLPTGFDKSLTFQLLPTMCKSHRSLGYEFPQHPLVVIVSPLMNIVEDQVMWLRSLGFVAAFVGGWKAKDGETMAGERNFNFIYGSPESLVGDEAWRNALINGHLGGLTPGKYAGKARDLLTFVANFKAGMRGLDGFCTFVASPRGKTCGFVISMTSCLSETTFFQRW